MQLRKHRQTAGQRRPVLAVTVFAMALLVAGAATLAGIRQAFADRVLPGVSVAGRDLGGTSAPDARRRVAAAAQRRIVVVGDGRSLDVEPRRAGRSVQVESTVRRAMDVGRRGPFGGLWATATLLAGSRDVSPAATVDEDRLRSTVSHVASRLERRPFPGAIAVEPGSLTVSSRAPRRGVSVDRPALHAILRRALMVGETRVIAPLRVRRVASRAAVASVARAAARYLRSTLRLTIAGRALALHPRRVARVLALTTTRSGVALGARKNRLERLVREIAQRTDKHARQARFSAPARLTTLDEKGDASWRPRRARVAVRPGRAGRAIDRRRAAQAISAAVRAGRHDVALPVRRIAPAVSATEARRVRHLIGTFTTYFQPGQPRVTNIRTIARAIDGNVVAPGAHFSLNQAAGERTRAKGYVEAPFIADGKIVPAVGGGVSQFSTTLYNAVYFAGLHIDAHQPHSLFIDRYPPGREATLNSPNIDLRWTNDTDAAVLIRATSNSNSVTVSLYGDNRGRRVRAISGPRRTVPGKDFAITVTRVVRYRGGRRLREPYITTYELPRESE